MNINDAFPSKYLRASDLKGRSVRVVMEQVVTEELGNDQKPILYFQGKEKGLALNKTNSQIIAATYGPETSGWKGQPLELYPDKTQFNGQIVDCLRCRIPVPAAREDEPTPF